MTAARPARVGIIGCGNVTDLYLRGCARLPEIELAACADIDAARSAALSAKGGFPAVSIEALLADPTIEIVLNLTPPTAHAGVSRAAIAAGKHVYSEKPLATTLDDAKAILADARASGVEVAGAPDTFLGGGLQTARALIDEGAIGEPIGANAAVMHPGPERWHPNPEFFYGPGGGPLLDVGPYYVAGLVSLLGPIVAVSAASGGLGVERTISTGARAGATFTAQVQTHAVAVYRFASGAIGGFTASFDVAATASPHIEIHGTAGSLSLGDPNRFDGAVRLRRFDDEDWTDEPLRFDGSVGRGIGLADMIAAIREGRSPRASGALAFHTLDVLLATEAASATHTELSIESTCERPAALD
jgi:predicted dehydrogenase